MKIPGYKVEHLIGRGGMAAVYLAIQESLDRRVALKVLDQTFADDPAFSERFLNEGRIIAALNHHNIITIYDIGIADDGHYISMEYVEGGDLKSRIAEGIPPDAALPLVKIIGGCLAFTHGLGVVHRDVKPANILFREDGTPLLTDFGIAKQLRTRNDLTQTGSVLGSPSYLAPEQAEGRELDGRADIYSLGIIFYEMLVGKKPFVGDTELSTIFKHLSEPIPALPSDLARCQPLLNRMIAKRPEDRFKDAAEMLRAIEELRTSGPLTSRPVIRRPAKGKTPREGGGAGRLTKWAGAGLAVAAIGAVAAVTVNALLPEPFVETREIKRLVDRILPSPGGGTVPPMHVTVKAPATPPPDLAATPRQEPTGATLTTAAQSGATAVNAPSEPSVVAAPPPPPPAKPEIDPIWYEIDKLLTLGDKAVQGYRLSTPPEDNAYYYYHQVLRLDPKNRKAKAGLTRVAMRYASLAEKEIARNDYRGAQDYVDRGLRAHDTEPLLLKLKQEVDTQLRIEDLLARANAALAERRLRTPPNDNAFFYYEKVLELEPGNGRAKRGFRAIAAQYAALAENHMTKYQYKKAQRYIALGLEVQPDNARLLSLKDRAGVTSAPKQFMNNVTDNVKGFFRGLKPGD
jgi:hypothetical protein